MSARLYAGARRGAGRGFGARSALWLGLGLGLGLSGCAELWGQSSTPNPDNCVRSGCADGLVCDPERQICVPFDPAYDFSAPTGPDLASPTSAPVSLLFPEYPNLDPIPIPLALAFQVATWEPSTMHYTLGGSEPFPGTAGTTSGPSPLKTRNFGGGTLSWRSESSTGGVFEAVRRRQVTMTASPQDLGMLAYDLRFTGSGGPLLQVSSGARVQGLLAWRAWRSTTTGYCPGCILQMVMSVEAVGIPTGGCAENIQNLGEFPGGTGELSFDFVAPEAAGEYNVRAGLTLQFFCDGTQPQTPVLVGRLRVR